MRSCWPTNKSFHISRKTLPIFLEMWKDLFVGQHDRISDTALGLGMILLFGGVFRVRGLFLFLISLLPSPPSFPCFFRLGDI